MHRASASYNMAAGDKLGSEELAKVPVRPNVQMQIQSLKKAKQRLESELQECKSNSQLRRFAMLQNDMQEADHVIQALRSALGERGCTSEQIDEAIDRRALQGDRLAGASRELLQRELRTLKAQHASGGGLITSKTYQTTNLDLCRAPRPGHPSEISAYSELIADIQNSKDRLLLAEAEVEWEVPQPPPTAEVECQVEGLEATPAEQLARELDRIKQVVAKLRGTQGADLETNNESQSIAAPSGASAAELEGDTLGEALAQLSKAEAKSKESEEAAELLREEVKRLGDSMSKGHGELEVVRARLAEKEAVIEQLQQQLVQGLNDLKDTQVTTAREAMETMTDHHSRQAAIIKDVHGAIVDCRTIVEEQSGRVDKLTLEQARHAEVGQKALDGLREEAADQRDRSARLQHDNRNMVQKLTAQTALLGHVRRLDREVVETIGDKVANNLGRTLPRKLTARLGSKAGRTSSSSQNLIDGNDASSSAPAPPAGLWAHADGSDASTVTEDAESPGTVARQSWRRRETRSPMPRPLAQTHSDTLRNSRRPTRSYMFAPPTRVVADYGTLHQSYGEEEDDLTAWDSLEELRPPPKMATGAVVRQELPLHTQKVVTWMEGTDADGTKCGQMSQEATEGLLEESRALRCELQGLLNAAETMEDETALR